MEMYKNRKNIAILLATYNGANYLRQQIESIIKQVSNDWTLYIHDDGSNDDTVCIIRNFADNKRIIFIDDNITGLGCRENFLHLLKLVESSFYMFCDQDDIWFPEMVLKFSAKLASINQNFLQEKLCLIHSNFSLVDSNLNVIKESVWDSDHFHPARYYDANYIVIASPVRGANMLINEQVRLLCIKEKSVSMMYDTWISFLVAKNKGLFYTIYEPTNVYRIHDFNLEGRNLLNKRKSISQIFKENVRVWRCLKEVDYGSFFKYVYYKMRVYFKI